MRALNQAGIDFIKRWEGKNGQPVLKTYADSKGIPTIGYGHIKNVHLGQVITAEQAEQFLIDDLAPVENTVPQLVKVVINDNQYAALCSFAFNVGIMALAHSTLLKDLNAGQFQAAADQFHLWDHAGVKEIQGLENRRLAERDLFLKKSE